MAGVRLALDAGADVNNVHNHLGTPAQAACMRGNDSDIDGNTTLTILRCLSEGNGGSNNSSATMDINAAGGYYGCALSAACSRAPIAVVRFELGLGASMKMRYQAGRHPVH